MLVLLDFVMAAQALDICFLSFNNALDTSSKTKQNKKKKKKKKKN